MKPALWVLLGSALAWGQEPVQPKVWDVPQPTDAVDVPSRIVAGGQPVAIHAVRSRLGVDALVLDFRRQFRLAGLFLPPPSHVPQLGKQVQVTGLDHQSLIAYSVFLQPNPDQTTTVILTETQVIEPARREAPVAFAPLLPGARNVLQSHTEGLQLVSYRATATPEEASAFHSQTLGAAGYLQVEPGRWERAGEVLKVTTRPEGSEVWVQISHRGRPVF